MGLFLVWPELNHINPHREALPTWQATLRQFFQPYSLYCCYFSTEWILVFYLLFFSVLPYAALLLCVCYYIILCSRNEERNKNRMPVLFLKSTVMKSLESEGSWLVNNYINLFLDLCVLTANLFGFSSYYILEMNTLYTYWMWSSDLVQYKNVASTRTEESGSLSSEV